MISWILLAEDVHEMGHGHLPFVLMCVVAFGVGAQWLASQVRVPSILLLLAAGVLAGPLLGIVNPQELLKDLLFPFVSMCVAIVLFEGAISLRAADWSTIRRPLLRLLTLGVAISWMLTLLAAHWVLGFSWFAATLLGAILVVTGPTVVGPLLRQMRPTGSVGPIARWEGIIIDPIGAVLAVLVFQTYRYFAVVNEVSVRDPILALITTVGVGSFLGIGAAWLLATCLRRQFVPDHLESPVTLAMVLTAFTLSNMIQDEAGLVTVTVMGIALANSNVSLRHVIEFKENLSVLLISTLFILLAARLNLSDFQVLGWRGPAFVAIMILLVRPLSVLIPLYGSSVPWNEQLLLAWLAPRGIVAAAVASVFALKLGADGKGLVPATFMVIIGTVVTYGLTSSLVARWLQLSSPDPQGLLIIGANRFAREFAAAVQKAGYPVLLVDANHTRTLEARMAGLQTTSVNILSEKARQEVDLGGIGRYLGMTENDEVNTLGGIHFAHAFGRANVFQFAPRLGSAAQRTPNAQHLQLHYLFEEGDSIDPLLARLESATIRMTTLTAEFDWDDFKQEHPNGQVLAYSSGKRLTLVQHGSKLDLRPGTTVIAMVEKKLPSPPPTLAQHTH